MKIFISYSTKDTEVANRVLAAVEGSGMECFIAPRDIRAGHVYAEEIMLNLEQSDVMLLILSNNSNVSQHVLREVERAVSNNIPIISYKIEEVALTPSMEYFLMPNQWMEASADGYDNIVSAIEQLGNSKEKGKPDRSVNFSAVEENIAASTDLQDKKKKGINWKTATIIVAVLWLITIVVFVSVKLFSRDTADNNNQAIASGDSQQSGIDGGDIKESKPIVLGDTVVFGSYLSEPVSWRVVDIDDEGVCTLISANVLCMKGFEGAESGKVWYTISGETKSKDRPFSATENREAFGGNDWEMSSLRAWLNSEKEVVSYIGQVPLAGVMCDGDNAYNSEKGFLKEFTKEELDNLLATEVITVFYNPENGEKAEKTTYDRVYLPSKEDLELLNKADVSIYCVPTETAINNDKSTMYRTDAELYDTSNCAWWLRTPLEDSYSELYFVTIGVKEEFGNYPAAVGGMGVRPMIRVKKEFLENN